MRITLTLLAFSVIASSGCLGPPVEGPQIDDVPPGFALDPNCEAARPVLPGERPVSQRCYWRNFNTSDPDSIVISEFGRVVDAAAAREAYELYVEKWVQCNPKSSYCETAGPLESVEANERAGWGYSLETRKDQQLSSADYNLILPYEGRTYTIEVNAGSRDMLDPALVRAIALRFAVRYTSDLLPVQIGVGVAFAVVVLLGAVWLRRQRRRSPAERGGGVEISAAPREAPDVGPPALLDAPRRVETLRRRFGEDPSGTIAELERLRTTYAPHPMVLHLLFHARLGARELQAALAVARDAWPVFLRSDRFDLAVDVYAHLGQHAPSIGLSRDQEVPVAQALLEKGVWQTAANIYGRALQANPQDRQAAIGLIRIAENRAQARGSGTQEAAQLCGFVQQTCQDSELRQRAARALARLTSSGDRPTHPSSR